MFRRYHAWLFAAAIAFSSLASAGDWTGLPPDGRTYESFWNEAMAKPHTISTSAKCTEIIANDAIYLFTTPDNPDHPALFIRRMVMKADGEIYMVTEGHWYRPGGTKPDLKAWMMDPFVPQAERKPQ